MKPSCIFLYGCFFSFCLLCTEKTFSQNDITFDVTPTCLSQEDGVIVATVVTEDYAPPFSFTWTDATGNTIPASQINVDPEEGICTVSSLLAGSYCVTITSDDGCEASSCDVVVEELSTPVINSITPICICPGSYGYGSVNLEITGGIGNFTYFWEGPNILPGAYFPSPQIPAPGGNYEVTIVDMETGCTATTSVNVGECNFDLSSFIEITPDCNEEGTSTISVQMPPGAGLGPFEFRWIKVGVGVVEFDPSTDGSASLENATAGQYCLKVQTMNGCDEQVCDIIVKDQPAPNVDYSVTPEVNGGDGVISLEVSGHPGPFSYLWATGETMPMLTGLESGEYSVIVRDDGSGCTSTASIDLYTCEKIGYLLTGQIQAIVTALSSGDEDPIPGAIDIINVTDQFPGYGFNFSWSNGEHTEDIDDLLSGWYTVTVTMDDCPNLSVIENWEICSFSVDINQSEGSNCNYMWLSTEISPSDDYSYQWSNGATTTSITGAVGTEYCVTVTSIGSNCSATKCIKPAFEDLVISLIDLQHSSYGLANGYIEVAAEGGYSYFGYQYNWSNGGDGTGLPPGNYTVTVTDACGSSSTATYSIQCELLEANIFGSVTDVSCSNATGGSIDLATLPFPGAPNPSYLYSWSNGATTQNITDLVEGEYCVTVTETTTGCVGFNCFQVGTSGTAAFTVGFNMQPGCSPLSEGQITAIPSNPNLGPFEYYWFNFNWDLNQTQYLGNTATLTNAPAAWYSVIVTDALGCSASNYTLMWPAAPAFVLIPISPTTGNPITGPVNVCPGQTASVGIDVSSGSSGFPVTWTWVNYSQYPLNSQTTNVGGRNDLTPGNWGVTVTDNHGCQAVTTFKVQLATSQISGTVVPNCEVGSSIVVTPKGYGPYTYLWSNGATTKDLTGLLSSGTYCVTVTNSLGCTSTKCFQVESVWDLWLYNGANIIDDNCSNDCIGSIDLKVKPSTPPATYLWSNGKTSQDIDQLCTGVYTVTISSNQCGEEIRSFEIENGLSSCGLISPPGSPNPELSSLYFSFPNMVLKAEKVNCFDDTCPGPPGDVVCSELIVEPIIPFGNCWTGQVEVKILQPGGSPILISFEIVSDVNGGYSVNWITGIDSWKPPQPGTYDIEIGYYGTTGVCETDFHIDWYGPGNYNDAVGFNDNFWFDWDLYPSVTDNFKNSYFGAWRCQVCKPENYYIMNNDQGECRSLGNWDFTFFNFKPSSYDGNPCNNGGLMEIMDFDANGEAVIQNVPITVPAIASLEGMQPFSNVGNIDIFCYESGWCLFKPEDVYGTTSPSINKPILATWSNPDECETIVWDDPGTPNPNPCSDSNPCPEPLLCDESTGDCYWPCDDNNDCVTGECVNGICVEDNQCDPPCPGDQQCHEGQCYLDEPICGFFVDVSGQGGENIYTFYNNTLSQGTVLSLSYTTYHIPDNIQVYGNGVEPNPASATGIYETGCIATSEPPANPPPNPLQFTIGSGNTIIVQVNTCGSPASKFNFEITCPEEFQNENPFEMMLGEMVHTDDGISIRPNPFTNEIELILHEVETDFKGQLIMLDNLGREIVRKETSFVAGYNSINLEGLGGLMEGIYFVLIKTEGKVYTSRKVIKVE